MPSAVFWKSVLQNWAKLLAGRRRRQSLTARIFSGTILTTCRFCLLPHDNWLTVAMQPLGHRHRMTVFNTLEANMKYMLLVYSAENAWTASERERCYEESIALTHELNKSGKFLGASPLHPVATATSVRIRDGKKEVTDGPFAETREQLGGYFLVDAPDLDEAINIAARIPAAKKGTVEIRPILELEGLPAEA
jgi:hypothetical protein